MKNIKWYIINEDNNLLCWENERAIEFECEEEAKEFLKMVLLKYPDFKMEELYITKAIVFYDGGYVSGAEATRLMLKELNKHT